MKYRKKPIVVEAFHMTDFDADYWPGWLRSADYVFDGGDLFLGTLEGDMQVCHGDWVIQGIKGELYPCKPDIFQATYEAVTDGQPISRYSIRSGWKMPEPPHPECKPYALLLGPDEGYDLFWATQQQAFDGDHWSDEHTGKAVIEWPFGQHDIVVMDDLKALGFLDAEEAEPEDDHGDHPDRDDWQGPVQP